MIAYLQGRVLTSSPERVVLDVGGVGYELHVPLSTYYEIERRNGPGPVALHVHTHLRDDGIALYGFWTERDKLLFLKLLAVGGIGPRVARQILSGATTDELLAAIAAGDVARLSRTPGVGKKTAERIVVELREKVRELAAGLAKRPEVSADEDLVAALVNLGYREAAAERAVARAREESPDGVFHELLRAALRSLSRA